MKLIYRQLLFSLFLFPILSLQAQTQLQKLFSQEVSIESKIDLATNGDILWATDSYNDTAAFFHRFVVLRLDANANILQSKGLFRPPSYRLSKIKGTSDNGLLLSGTANIPLTDNDSVFVIKLDANADISWAKGFQLGMDIHEIRDIYETSDGSYIISGLFENFNLFEAEIFVVKIDPNGTFIWSRRIKSQLSGAFLKVGGIIEGTNGDLYLSGVTRFNSEGSWIAQLSSDGLIQNVTFLDTHNLTDSQPEPFAIHRLSNGEMDIFYTKTAFTDQSALLKVRTDASGVPLQAKRYYIPHANGGEFTAIYPKTDGSYLLSGYHFPSGIRSNGLAMEIDPNGNVSWTGDYGTPYIELFEGIVPAADGGLVMVGFADPDSVIISPSENGLFPWLVKTDAMGVTDCFYSPLTISSNDTTVQSSAYQLTEAAGPGLGDMDFSTFDLPSVLDSLVCEPTVIEYLAQTSFNLYPNPTQGSFVVELNKPFPGSSLIVSDAMGRSVLRSSLQNQTTISLDIDGPSGLYFLTLLTPSGERLTRKLVLE